MDLWIRSQDKRNLKKINTEIYIKEGLSNYAEGDVYFIVSSGTELGEYKTKDRALEVLDEIQEKLSVYSNARVIGEHQELLLKLMALMISEQIIVYEMPKE